MYMWIASLGVRSVAGVARCVREVMVERRAGGGGSCWGRTVLLLLLALAVLCCGGETTGGSPRHHTSLATDILARYPGQDDYISPTRKVLAAAGGTTDLPCNLTSPLPNDSARLVLWYKHGIHKPIYSYDMRNGPATHWKNPAHLGSRASFDVARNGLSIQRVEPVDEGTYRCRVDFRTNPTLTFITNLSVIVPPRSLVVYTELGVEVRSIVGPFLEGDTLSLSCRAVEGSPPPRVSWWEGAVLLDMTAEEETSDQVTNTLLVPSLSRRDLHRPLTCKATNTNLTVPLVATVTIDMNFPPLWVNLEGEREPLSAGRPYDMVCQAVGARPPAVITWRLDDMRLTTHTDKTSQEGNVTRSELRWTPSVRDAGKRLSCQADSPALDAAPMVDQWLLQIYYVPVARLRPGRSLNLSNIEEGDDVYFECSIQANPWVYKITWLHEGKELEHNVTAGIIISNQSLVLQRVSRMASGNYYCVASNIEGDGHSNPILLRVKYAPVCHRGQMMYHGAAKYEQVNIPCKLDAHPKPLSFKWTFNNSGESVDIPQDHIQVSGSQSTVSYTPNTELDYGTLLCWGTNAVGTQRHPCVFHVFPAGRPDPVHNCSVYNLSVTVVNVRCVAGFDGGLPQTFILELYEPHSNRLLANVTNKVPTFTVPGLSPGLALMGVVYSTNEKGRGEMVSLQVYTIKDVAERRTAAVKPPPTHGMSSSPLSNMTSIIALVAGVVGGLLVVVVVICVVVRLRYERGPEHRVGECGGRVAVRAAVVGCKEEVGVGMGVGGPVAASPLAATTTLKDLPPPPSSPRDADEKNPDVIPQSDSDSWHIEGVNTISSASLPATYATLPRAAHLYTHAADYQGCGAGSGGVQYAELLLTRAAAATPPHCHQQQQQRVVYATLDHQPAQYPPPHQHHAYPQPSTATTTPTHALHHHTPTHSAHPQQQQQQQQQASWAPSARTIARRHSLRRDPYVRDHEAAVPLITSQKESSV